MLDYKRNYTGNKTRHAVVDMPLECWLLFRVDQASTGFPEWLGWKYYYEDEHLAVEGRSLTTQHLREHLSNPLLDMAAELAFESPVDSSTALMLEKSAYSAAHATIDKDAKLAVKDAET
jgi:hypothetical protein